MKDDNEKHKNVLIKKDLKKIIVNETIKKTMFDSFIYFLEEEPDDLSEINVYNIEKNNKTKIKLLRELHDEFYSMILGELEDAIQVRTIDLNNIIEVCKVDNHSKINLLQLKLKGIELTGTEQVFNPARYDDALKWIFHIIDKLKLKTGFIRCRNKAEDLMKAVYLKNNGYPYVQNTF